MKPKELKCKNGTKKKIIEQATSILEIFKDE